MIDNGAIVRKRVDYIDIAKGIGILFVILGHSEIKSIPLLPILSGISWTFHMPLFFIISGLCFRKKGKEIFSNLLRRLVLPFYFTIFLFVVYYWVLRDINESKNWIWGGVYCSGYDYTTPFYIKGVGGIWFLLALFWAKVILNGIVHLPEHIVLLLVGLLAYWGVVSYSRFVLPIEIQNGCVGLLFLYIGHLAYKYELLKRLHFPLLVFSLLIWGFGIKNGYGHMTLVNCKVNLMTIISSCCACYVILFLSMFFEKSELLCRIFTWIGKSTIIILCFHIFELHTGISRNISITFFETDNVDVIFVVRMIWCLFFALIIPKLPIINKVFYN